jgi:acyl-CoA synthetase (AMP-forming)/AMP-acid ligase II
VNVAQFLRRAAAEHPEQPALIEGETTLTYAEWLERVGRVASVLRRLGVERGDRVALLMANSAALLESLFGVLTVGAVVVPINTRLHPKEYEYMLEHSGSKVLIYDGRFDEGLRTTAIAERDVPLLRVGAGVGDAIDYEEAVAPADDFGPAVEVAGDDLAWLFYTSGTTGRPKGAMVTHGNLEFMTDRYFAEVYAASTADRALHAGPLTHGSGLWAIPLTAAAATHVVPRSPSFDPAEIFDLIGRHRITKLVFLSPTMIKMLIEHDAAADADCASLRFVGYGGAPIHPDDLQAAIDRWGYVLCNIYGQGECPMTISMLSPADHERAAAANPERLRSVGPPRGVIEVAVCDEEARILPAGEVGEICVNGPVVMRGYWTDPSATEEVFRLGWYHTGDLGTFDEDGYLYLLDRTKELVISGGANIYPREVENVLLQHDGVREAAVFGVPDRFWGESVVAVVVPRGDGSVSAEELIDLCRSNLASYKKPRWVVFVDELPRSAYGKVLKRELAERFSSLAEGETAQ